MYDPYLDALLHGNTAPHKKPAADSKKNKFDRSIEEQIDKYIDSLDLESEGARNPLINPAMKRARLREELKAEMQMPELEKFIPEAFTAILTDDRQYLSPELCSELENELLGIDEEIEKLDLDNLPEENLQSIFKITDDAMEGILTIAIEKYKEEAYQTSLAIFNLLASLNPGNSDYWYRLGIAAQKCENYPLALKAYGIALEMAPDLIGALVLSCECHYLLGQKDEAKQILLKVKGMRSDSEPSETRNHLISKLEQVLK